MLTLVCSVLLAAPRVESRFEQVAPVRAEPARSEGQTRAVVLLHGYTMHFRAESVPVPAYRDWQQASSGLVKRLGEEGDVFVFAYGQNAALDDVVAHGGLLEYVARLRKLGYRDIVLVGHSAGGLVARHFVEDHPDCGVTKVIQVCTPNGGCPSAKAKVVAAQQAFVDCLSEDGRKAAVKARAGKRIPAHVDFVCLLGNGGANNGSDGLVPCGLQWTADLCAQGVPVVPLEVRHPQAMRSARGAEALARLVREKQPRWTPEQVERVRRELFPTTEARR